MNIQLKTRQAYSEIDEFLSLLSEEKRNEIPQKLRDFFKEEKDKEYIKKIDKDVPIKDQNLKKETLAIIGLLNLQYWCKDEEEKKRLSAIYEKNEKEYQESLHEKYNANDLFGKNETLIEKSKEDQGDNTKLIEYKESRIKKVIEKILNFLHLK